MAYLSKYSGSFRGRPVLAVGSMMLSQAHRVTWCALLLYRTCDVIYAILLYKLQNITVWVERVFWRRLPKVGSRIRRRGTPQRSLHCGRTPRISNPQILTHFGLPYINSLCTETCPASRVNMWTSSMSSSCIVTRISTDRRVRKTPLGCKQVT